MFLRSAIPPNLRATLNYEDYNATALYRLAKRTRPMSVSSIPIV
jgi:hypothetical protein